MIGAAVGFLLGIGVVYLIDFESERTALPKTPELAATEFATAA